MYMYDFVCQHAHFSKFVANKVFSGVGPLLLWRFVMIRQHISFLLQPSCHEFFIILSKTDFSLTRVDYCYDGSSRPCRTVAIRQYIQDLPLGFGNLTSGKSSSLPFRTSRPDGSSRRIEGSNQFVHIGHILTLASWVLVAEISSK